MSNSKDEKIVFFMGAPSRPDAPTTVIIGIPKAAWEYMQDGKTNHFTLEAFGIPVQLMLFGAENQEQIMEFLKKGAENAGTPLIDERHKDHSIKRKYDA